MCGSGHQNMIHACNASLKDYHPLHAALVISPKFSSMFNYILFARRKILIELPNMHPLARDSVDSLMYFHNLDHVWPGFSNLADLRLNIATGKSLQANYNFSNTCDYKHKLSALVSTIAFVITPDHVVWNSPTLFYRLLLTRNCYLIRNDG